MTRDRLIGNFVTKKVERCRAERNEIIYNKCFVDIWWAIVAYDVLAVHNRSVDQKGILSSLTTITILSPR